MDAMTKQAQDMLGAAALLLIWFGALRTLTLRTWNWFRWGWWAAWVMTFWI